MTQPLGILHGRFGRVALLDMDDSLCTHAHPQCHVVIKVSGADTRFVVNRTEYVFTDGMAVLVNAWEPHHYRHVVPDARALFLALYIEPVWLAAVEKSLAASGCPHFFRQSAVELTPGMQRLTDALVMEMLGGAVLPTDTLETQIFDLMAAFAERGSEWRRTPMRIARYDPRIERAIDYMRDNVRTTLDMGDVASRAFLSRPHFFSLFRRELQMTPAVYANVLRMELACRSLGDSTAGRLGGVSDDLGFTRQHHFSRFFRKHQGVTPRAYQRSVNVIAHPGGSGA